VASNTSFKLQHAKVFESLDGKNNPHQVFTDFTYNDSNSAWNYLAKRLDLSGCEDVRANSNYMKMLHGRPRQVLQTINTR
jgi:hypothetical protein